MVTNPQMKKYTFSEQEIQALFGYEAAEDESIERLKQYFFKSDIYDKIDNDLPLRILVGHKGIGKSAFFKVAYAKNLEEKEVSLWVKPDDIVELAIEDDVDFLVVIRNWKRGLEKLIIDKVLENVISSNIESGTIASGIKKGYKILDSLAEILNKEKGNVDKAKEVIVKNFFAHKNVFVYIDDLDRGWTGSKTNIRKISALLSAVRDLSNDNKGLCFRISLRSDVYFLVRTADESTDKIDGNVLWLSWTSHQILVLLAKRIQSHCGNPFSEKDMMKKPQFIVQQHFNGVFVDKFEGDGKWKNAPIYKILVSLIRRRPRDLVKLCTLAARAASTAGHHTIMTEDLQNVFDKYSQDRIQDIINEHRYELPDIERLIMGMKPNKVEKRTELAYVYNEESIIRKIEGIMQKGQFLFANGQKATARELLVFLYKVNFLVGRKQTNGYLDRRYFEDNKYIATDYAVFGYEWEVHPAFRWALYPEIRDIYKFIDLEEEVFS